MTCRASACGMEIREKVKHRPFKLAYLGFCWRLWTWQKVQQSRNKHSIKKSRRNKISWHKEENLEIRRLQLGKKNVRDGSRDLWGSHLSKDAEEEAGLKGPREQSRLSQQNGGLNSQGFCPRWDGSHETVTLLPVHDKVGKRLSNTWCVKMEEVSYSERHCVLVDRKR